MMVLYCCMPWGRHPGHFNPKISAACHTIIMFITRWRGVTWHVHITFPSIFEQFVLQQSTKGRRSIMIDIIILVRNNWYLLRSVFVWFFNLRHVFFLFMMRTEIWSIPIQCIIRRLNEQLGLGIKRSHYQHTHLILRHVYKHISSQSIYNIHKDISF